MTDFITQIDLSVLNWLADHVRCGFLDLVMPYITHLSDGGILWITLAIILAIPKSTRKVGLMMILAVALGFIICNLALKPIVARTRPYDINTLATVLIKKPTDFSFPSGHTTAAFAAASSLIISGLRLPGTSIKAGFIALALAILTAFSRLYIYVHYPSDVLAGMLIGTASGFAACYIVNAALRRHDV